MIASQKDVIQKSCEALSDMQQFSYLNIPSANEGNGLAIIDKPNKAEKANPLKISPAVGPTSSSDAFAATETLFGRTDACGPTKACTVAKETAKQANPTKVLQIFMVAI